MALRRFSAVIVVVLVSCLLAPPAVMASSVNISGYWGTNSGEGSVIDVCHSNLYSIVNIGFVGSFGNGSTPTLILAHCKASVGGCTYLGREIEDCQSRGIKVFISIGGPNGGYTLTSEDDAKKVANYLWNAYLGGKNSSVNRPFGDKAIVDGVDFFIEGSTTLYWDVLAEALKNLSTDETPIELSAAPKCHYPDQYLGAVIETGIFDHVQVRFYNDVCCQYDGSFDDMKRGWDEWTNDDKIGKLFVGVTANNKDQGYVGAQVLINNFLADVVNSTKFGGVAVWYIFNHAYTEAIKEWNYTIPTTTTSHEASHKLK